MVASSLCGLWYWFDILYIYIYILLVCMYIIFCISALLCQQQLLQPHPFPGTSRTSMYLYTRTSTYTNDCNLYNGCQQQPTKRSTTIPANPLGLWRDVQSLGAPASTKAVGERITGPSQSCAGDSQLVCHWRNCSRLRFPHRKTKQRGYAASCQFHQERLKTRWVWSR